MDIISHGLWGGALFFGKGKKIFLSSFLIGVAPDLFSFGVHFLAMLSGLSPMPAWQFGPPDSHLAPSYVYMIYNFTHSLVIFTTVFLLIWLIRKKPVWLLLPWGLHILIDIPTHAADFFPTPFLWPVSGYSFSGVAWVNPRVFFTNLPLLILIYAILFLKKKKHA